MYSELTEDRIGWCPRPRWIPRRVWLKLIDLTTRPDYKVRRARPVLTKHIVVLNSILRTEKMRGMATDDAVERLSYQLGSELIGHLVGAKPKTITVTLEHTDSLGFEGITFCMTVWEYE